MAVKWKGTPVPNSGTITKLCVNNNLSIEEVENIVAKLEPGEDYEEYIVTYDADSSCMILIVTMESKIVIAYYYPYNPEPMPLFANSEGFGTSFVGFNPEITNFTFDVNYEAVSDAGGMGQVGVKNELLSSLISITPFEKVEDKPENPNVKEFRSKTTIIKNPVMIGGSGGSDEDNNKYIDFTSVVSETEKVPFVNNMMIYVDTSNVTDMNYMFSNCNNLTTIPQLDTSNVTNMEMMFYQCSKITTIPQLDTSNVNNMAGMFYACVALTNVPELDTSKVTSMSEMFAYCRGLLCTPNLDTSNVQNMRDMFLGCTNLSEVLALDTSNVTDMFQMFYECSSLTNVPELDTSNVTDMNNMFYNCTNLTTVSSLNLKSIENKNHMYHMFSGCNNLENLTLKNIPFDLSLADSPNLTVDSLLNTIQELISSSTMKKLILGSTNYDKLSNIYVKLTNEPEEESGIIKKPFVVCDSTDEGAMKIGSYASSKNWSIQSS